MASVRLPQFLRATGLVVAISFAYWGSLDSPFLFDDADAVVNNATLRGPSLLSALVPPADGSATTGRPLVNLSLAIDRALYGDNVRGYHVTNLAIHAGAALALFGLLRWIFKRDEKLSSVDSLAWLGALLWAVHPLQTETVVSIAQRTELLCGSLYLATLYAFLRGAAASSRVWLAASLVACLAGMAAKEVMVTAPVVVLLLDRTFMAGSFAAAWRVRRTYYLLLASTWLLLAALVLSRGGMRGEAAGFGLGVTPWSYLLTQADAIVLYVRLVLWPYPLVLDYGSEVVRSLSDVAWQAALVVGALGAMIWALVRRPVAGFFGVAFFLILAPSSSFVPLVTQTIAEHRMYLPLAVLLTGFVVSLRGRLRWLLVPVAVAWGGLTVLRMRDYRDPVTIWSDTVAKRPANPRAHHNLALAYQAQGDAAAAHQRFARVIDLRPDYAPARYNWGVALLARGRRVEAAEQLDAAARVSPALRHEPKFTEAQFELGRLAEREGDLAAAEFRWGETVRLAPSHAAARARLGLLLARSERLEPAAEQFRALIAARPDDADAHANLGNILLLLGRPSEAISHYEEALRLRPGDPRAAENIRLAREALR
ncbi:MAG: tetratricopeptide repeat protein [Opitutaceae bacterium]|nr:tetratricopeptide repeat protein [Opitutaceae bacterium]